MRDTAYVPVLRLVNQVTIPAATERPSPKEIFQNSLQIVCQGLEDDLLDELIQEHSCEQPKDRSYVALEFTESAEYVHGFQWDLARYYELSDIRDIAYFLKLQLNGEPGFLRTDGSLEVFYLWITDDYSGIDGDKWIMSIRRARDQWQVLFTPFGVDDDHAAGERIICQG